jgi:hypothetical protein
MNFQGVVPPLGLKPSVGMTSAVKIKPWRQKPPSLRTDSHQELKPSVGMTIVVEDVP